MRISNSLNLNNDLLAAPPPPDIVRELLHLDFRHYSPAPTLRPWVQGYWAINTQIPVARREHLYPDGGSSITLDFSDSGMYEPHFCAFRTMCQTTLTGHVDLFGVRLHPGGAFGLLGQPAEALSDHTWTLQDLSIGNARLFYEQMREAPPALRPKLMDAWLLQLATTRPAPGIVQRLLPVLADSERSLDDALLRAGVGRRSFERLFNIEVGLAPNQLKLMLRVRRARFLIKAAPWLNLGEVAQRCGYFDQAHFIRQFRSIAGTTPGGYRKRQLDRLARGELFSRHATSI